jgi:hypothetical protein
MATRSSTNKASRKLKSNANAASTKKASVYGKAQEKTAAKLSGDAGKLIRTGVGIGKVNPTAGQRTTQAGIRKAKQAERIRRKK